MLKMRDIHIHIIHMVSRVSCCEPLSDSRVNSYSSSYSLFKLACNKYLRSATRPLSLNLVVSGVNSMRVDGFTSSRWGMNKIIIGKNRMMKSASFLVGAQSLTKEYVWELALRPWIAIPRERGRRNTQKKVNITAWNIDLSQSIEISM